MSTKRTAVYWTTEVLPGNTEVACMAVIDAALRHFFVGPAGLPTMDQTEQMMRVLDWAREHVAGTVRKNVRIG